MKEKRMNVDDKKIKTPKPIIGSIHYSQALSDLATKHIENMILIMQEQWCKYLRTKDLDSPKH